MLAMTSSNWRSSTSAATSSGSTVSASQARMAPGASGNLGAEPSPAIKPGRGRSLRLQDMVDPRPVWGTEHVARSSSRVSESRFEPVLQKGLNNAQAAIRLRDGFMLLSPRGWAESGRRGNSPHWKSSSVSCPILCPLSKTSALERGDPVTQMVFASFGYQAFGDWQKIGKSGVSGLSPISTRRTPTRSDGSETASLLARVSLGTCKHRIHVTSDSVPDASQAAPLEGDDRLHHGGQQSRRTIPP
jgi:hypothetical protein